MISRTRLQQQLADLQDVTAPGKGINRLAFTDADWQGRAYLMGLMREAGMELREDAFGNVIGHVKGADESLPAVMFGSHGDSVPQGGNFDGIVGILAAIETCGKCPLGSFQKGNIENFLIGHDSHEFLLGCTHACHRRGAGYGEDFIA